MHYLMNEGYLMLFNKVQDGSRRLKKVQKGSRWFKKAQEVQEGLGRFKKVHEGSRWFKKGRLKKVLVQEGSDGLRRFKTV